MRGDDKGSEIGTKVAMMFVKMATDVGDPSDRLARDPRGTTVAAKEMRSALSAQRLMNLTDTHVARAAEHRRPGLDLGWSRLGDAGPCST